MLRAILNAIMQALMSPWHLLIWGAGAVDRLFGGGAGNAPAPPVDNLETALPEPERLQRAEELAAGEVKAVDNLMTRSPAQQAQIFASMEPEDRILADLSLLRPDQIDWLNGLKDGQLRMIAETTEKRVAAALAGEPKAMPAILSVGQSAPQDETSFAHRLAAKRASQLSPTHPPAYSLQ